MELKQVIEQLLIWKHYLLIVPYGIETGNGACSRRSHGLLIVPYGIETLKYRHVTFSCALLIVPYGIET